MCPSWKVQTGVLRLKPHILLFPVKTQHTWGHGGDSSFQWCALKFYQRLILHAGCSNSTPHNVSLLISDTFVQDNQRIKRYRSSSQIKKVGPSLSVCFTFFSTSIFKGNDEFSLNGLITRLFMCNKHRPSKSLYSLSRIIPVPSRMFWQSDQEYSYRFSRNRLLGLQREVTKRDRKKNFLCGLQCLDDMKVLVRIGRYVWDHGKLVKLPAMVFGVASVNTWHLKNLKTKGPQQQNIWHQMSANRGCNLHRVNQLDRWGW